MGFLMQGAWHGDDASQIGAQGWEPRQEHISGRIGEAFPPEAGRYHLIVCPGCPLSHRVSIVHRLKRLQDVVTTSLVRPVMGPNGREFGDAAGPAPDPVTGHRYLHELYTATQPDYSGRDSTPVLWDRHSRQIVSNTYRDILAMLNSAFDAFTDSGFDARPAALSEAVDRELAAIGAGLFGSAFGVAVSAAASLCGPGMPALLISTSRPPAAAMVSAAAATDVSLVTSTWTNRPPRASAAL